MTLYPLLLMSVVTMSKLQGRDGTLHLCDILCVIFNTLKEGAAAGNDNNPIK